MRCAMLLLLAGGLLFSSDRQVSGAENWNADWLFKAEPEGAVALGPKHRLWRDEKRNLVILDGEVCLREGALEMFACPRQTKEHESIVVVDALPGVVHRELVKVGAKPGKPASFNPFQAATGTPIEVMVLWVGSDGKRHAVPAQQWIRQSKTEKKMEQGWVFGGSRFQRDPDSDRVTYLADGGDFICVANFGSASIDLASQSSPENATLLYEAWTDQIPPKGTKVRLVLVPKLEKPAQTK